MNKKEIEKCVKIVITNLLSKYTHVDEWDNDNIEDAVTLIMGYIPDYPVYSPILPTWKDTWTDTKPLYPTCMDDITKSEIGHDDLTNIIINNEND